MKRIAILTFVLCACVNSAVFSHEWFAALADVKSYKAGDAVPLTVYVTHHFMVGEGVSDSSRNAFFVLQGNAPTNTRVRTTRNEAAQVLSAEFALPAGAPTVVLVNSVGSFSHTTTAGVRGGTKETLKALGFTISKSTLREGWCKIYVNPSAEDKSFAQPLGLPLEIVPVTNPADIATGKPALFKVFQNGKPLANATVSATYKSFNSTDEEAWAVKGLKTDSTGQVTLNMPSAAAAKDIWVVKTDYSGDVSGNPAYDAAAYSSWASFVVRK
ncbi:MAG: DUF4198 domain-containing protein [Spirochaetaceae bacterium]|jgi:hypothetical protein|nr:DUF4198 domain-containing protein [Spirochaetaceae bacterium]